MFKFRNKVKAKKGLLALDALIGTILSVIALFFIFQVFASTFLQTPTNLDIAKQNAQSIVDFVDYSEKKSNSLEILSGCYNMLKLTNIENFQLESDDNKYFYIINNKGVYLFKFDYLSEVITKQKFSETKKVKFIEFKNNLNLKVDKTDSYTFSFEIYGNSVLTNDNKINSNTPGNFILLVPQFKIFDKNCFNSFLSIFDFLDSNQNNLIGRTLFESKFDSKTQTMINKYEKTANVKGYAEANNVKLSEEQLDNTKQILWSESIGNYLIYNPKNNNLFLSYSELSNSLIKVNLCYRFQIQNENIEKKNEQLKKTPKKLNYLNNIIKFQY